LHRLASIARSIFRALVWFFWHLPVIAVRALLAQAPNVLALLWLVGLVLFVVAVFFRNQEHHEREILVAKRLEAKELRRLQAAELLKEKAREEQLRLEAARAAAGGGDGKALAQKPANAPPPQPNGIPSPKSGPASQQKAKLEIEDLEDPEDVARKRMIAAGLDVGPEEEEPDGGYDVSSDGGMKGTLAALQAIQSAKGAAVGDKPGSSAPAPPLEPTPVNGPSDTMSRDNVEITYKGEGGLAGWLERAKKKQKRRLDDPKTIQLLQQQLSGEDVQNLPAPLAAGPSAPEAEEVARTPSAVASNFVELERPPESVEVVSSEPRVDLLAMGAAALDALDLTEVPLEPETIGSTAEVSVPDAIGLTAAAFAPSDGKAGTFALDAGGLVAGASAPSDGKAGTFELDAGGLVTGDTASTPSTQLWAFGFAALRSFEPVEQARATPDGGRP
jgi:hypothetical protein